MARSQFRMFNIIDGVVATYKNELDAKNAWRKHCGLMAYWKSIGLSEPYSNYMQHFNGSEWIAIAHPLMNWAI